MSSTKTKPAAKAAEGTADSGKAGQELATHQDQLPAELGAYADFAGGGFENQTSEDYTIPFINILQALSPQLQENDDLKQGMLFNTVTGEAFPGKEGLAFIPATTSHEFVEFKPRETGGGFVGRHDVDSEVVKHAKDSSVEFGKYATPEGNELAETFNVYGIAVLPDGCTQQAVIAFSSSKIKKYKAWMTKAKTIQIMLPNGRRISAPLFAHRYRLKTATEKNSKGTFSNFDISFDGENAAAARLLPSDPLFQEALAIKDLLDSGKARAAYESQSTAGDGESGAAGGKPAF